MKRLRPYPAYKPTGLAWLPEVPREWETLRGKFLFTKMERPVRPQDEVVTCFRDGEVTLRKNRRLEGFTESLKEIGYQGVRKGDLVIHVMDAFAGSVGVSDSDGKSTPVYSVCVPKKSGINNYYYAHIVRVMAKTGYIQSLYRGIRERSSDFRFEVFGNQFLPIPPPAEQEAIVAYLDEKTAKIDRLIELKEREIKLLNEKKQALISKVVTRGLDPNVEAPLWPLKHITTKIGSGKTPSGGANVYVSTGVMFIRSQNVYYNEIRTDDISCITEAVDSEMAGTRVKKGDVLLNITGGSIGRCACFNLDVRANVNQHVCIIRPNRDIVDSAYLAAVIFSDVVQTQIWQCQNEGNRESLNFDQIARFRIPLPPLPEQREIVAYLDAEGAKTDKAIAAVTRQIGLLKEYRTRLISDAVTGRIDLRKL